MQPSAEECYHQMAEEKARKEAKAKSKKKKPKQSSKAVTTHSLFTHYLLFPEQAVAKVTAIAKAAQQRVLTIHSLCTQCPLTLTVHSLFTLRGTPTVIRAMMMSRSVR